MGLAQLGLKPSLDIAQNLVPIRLVEYIVTRARIEAGFYVLEAYRLEFFGRQVEQVDKQVFAARRTNDLCFRVLGRDLRNCARMVRFGVIGDDIIEALDT